MIGPSRRLALEAVERRADDVLRLRYRVEPRQSRRRACA
jgi:hypothetical protein